MKIIFAGQVPKDNAYQESCEDIYSISEDQRIAVISDGASESFDSVNWAKLLVHQFLQMTSFSLDSFKDAITQYVSLHDFSSLSWSKQIAFERGSFATLLGIKEVVECEMIEITCIGDSAVFLLDGDELINAIPYTSSRDFQNNPELLSTNNALNGFIEKENFLEEHVFSWKISNLETPRLFCMSDALAEWTLKHYEQNIPMWDCLLKITNKEDLQSLVDQERYEKKMKIDDTTLLILGFGN